ncbi:hypothetical protein COO04_06855 [Bacillus toyonensis]|nr:hypothetical protein [Bacillus cereus group sp. N31]PEG16693.1 hypothetical protein COO04_06855 [Bacillus toyonensis]PEK07400.1 hypothetical protein CN681_22195 [Bacillus toyonensis]PGA53284.1 hypothetical protein COL86_21265 [Bacillus toyonensis]PGC05536.1 hypothetical protein COM19_01585 [Bacillus toyonensis]
MFQLKLDIFVDNGSSPIIIDTKWKSLMNGNRSEVRQEDLFQIYICLTGYNRIQTAVLLYTQWAIINKLNLGILHAEEEKKLKVYAVPLRSKSQVVEDLSQILQVNGFENKYLILTRVYELVRQKEVSIIGNLLDDC